jgi:transcription termination factor NusB
MTGPRRRARAIALQALYEIDATRHGSEVVLSRLLMAEELSDANRVFIRELVSYPEVCQHLAAGTAAGYRSQRSQTCNI